MAGYEICCCFAHIDKVTEDEWGGTSSCYLTTGVYSSVLTNEFCIYPLHLCITCVTKKSS